MNNYYLTPHGDNWKLSKEDSQRATKVFETKEEAKQFSVDFMNRNGGSLHIQKQNGQFQEERTYPRSSDPKKSKG